MLQVRSFARRTPRLLLATVCAGMVGAVIPALASAATQSPVKLDGAALATPLGGGGSFSLYKFDLSKAATGVQSKDWVAPFTEPSNLTVTRYGHCIELDQASASTSTAILLSGDDLSVDNAGKNTITAGDDDPRVAQLEWLLASSYLHRADADYANGIAAGAHQSAIWKVVNPTNAANDIGTATAARATADAMADRLLAAAQANAAALDPATWSLTLSGPSDATCAGSARTLVVKGNPSTTAHLTITSGTATFANGLQSVDLALGDTGAAQVVLTDTADGADAVAVQASLPDWTLAQVDNGPNQDFAYLVAGAPVVKTLNVAFVPCANLIADATGAATFTRSYPWTVEKTAGTPVVSNAAGTATIPYRVTATRGPGVDTAFAVAGSIRVGNPNGTDVTAHVTVSLAGTPCEAAASVAVPAGALATLPYSCALASPPAGELAPSIQVSWTRAGLTDGSVSASAAPVSFGAPTTTLHPAVDVLDAFNGGAAQAVGTCTGPTCSYDLQRAVAIPSTPDCTEVTNTAMVRDGASDLDVSTVASSICRTPERLVLSKTSTPSFDRSFDWTIVKDVDRSKVTTDAGAAAFTYTVTATKGAPVDGGWRLAGEVTVQNPNPYPVAHATVTAEVSNGGTCTVTNGSDRTVPARGSLTAAYGCAYPASGPTAAAGTTRATVAHAPYGCPTCALVVETLEPQAFAFGAPTSVAHDSVRATDVFGGVSSDLESALTASRSFVYTRTVSLTGVAAGACVEVGNVARLAAFDDAALVRVAERTVEACRDVPTTSGNPGGSTDTPGGGGGSDGSGGSGGSTTITTDSATPGGTPAAPGGSGAKSGGASTTTLTLTKTADRRSVAAGGRVRFILAVRNTGTSAATNVEVCDRLPAAMVFVSTPGARMKKGRACFAVRWVKAGATARFRVVARVSATVGVGITCNNATVTARNAGTSSARICVDTRPQTVTANGGFVGVTG